MPLRVRDILELGGSLGFLDEMYDQFQSEPNALDPSWRDAFGTATPEKSNGHPTTGNGQTQPTNGNGNGRRPVTGTTRAMPMFARPGAVTMSPITATQGSTSV